MEAIPSPAPAWGTAIFLHMACHDVMSYSSIVDAMSVCVSFCLFFSLRMMPSADMHYTTIGAVYTLLCVILAALKAVMSGEILTGDLKLHPMDLLLKMCPLALMQITIMCLLSGELTEIMARWSELVESSTFSVLLLSGALSFSLNWSSFMANKVTSPLTLCIAANVKQVRDGEQSEWVGVDVQ